MFGLFFLLLFFFFKQKTAYEMRINDWSSDVCSSDLLDWVAPSGRGTVHSTTVIRRRPQDGGDYNVALIDLAEGVRMMSRVEGVAPDQVRIDMAVSARLAEDDGDVVVVFDPVQEGDQIGRAHV